MRKELLMRFKRFIVWLFNIKQEDLPGQTRNEKTLVQVPYERDILKQEILKEIQDTLQKKIISSVDQRIDQKIFEFYTSSLLKEADKRETIISEPENCIESGGTTSSDDLFPLIIEEDLSPKTPEGSIERDGGIKETEPDIIEEPILPLEDEIDKRLDEVGGSKIASLEVNSIRLGVDFGTTTTAISLRIGNELPEALPIGIDGVTRYMPSIVYFLPGSGDLEQRVVVGEEAESFGDQTYIIRSVKRCLGCDGTYCKNRAEGFPWCRGDGKIQISEKEYLLPQQIMSFIVAEAITRAKNIIKERYKIDLTWENFNFIPLNIGCGAKFNYKQRDILKEVTRDLGFNQVNIENVIEEPILAGFTYSRFSDYSTGKILIYDFGGGTLDVAILSVDDVGQGFRVSVLTTAGDSWFGGDDIDSLVYNYFIAKICEDLGIPSVELKAGLNNIEIVRLRSRARQAKEQLSFSDNYLEVLLSENFGPLNIELSRTQFETILVRNKILEKSLKSVEQACQLAFAFENACEANLLDYSSILKYDLTQARHIIDKVILVGGVTKIPYIRNGIEQIFPARIVSDILIDPISAVAIGGAYPREPQHYSLNSPPYDLYIQAYEKTKNEEIEILVFEAFEFLDFHLMWRQNARPAYKKRIPIATDLTQAKLNSRLSRESEFNMISNIGYIKGGDWCFGVTLDGEMFCEMTGEKLIDLGSYPVVHPIQKRIRDARHANVKIPDNGGDFQSWMREMMNEN